MNERVIAQEGPPREVYEKPNSRYVAEFIGTTNFLPGRVVGRGPDGVMLTVETKAGVVACRPSHDGAQTSNVLVSVRPEYVGIDSAPDRSGIA